MKVLLIGEAHRLGAEPTSVFRLRGHTLAATDAAGALERVEELAPDVIVLDTGAVDDHATQGPDLASRQATRSIPVLTVRLDARLRARDLVALIERVAGLDR